jgi:NADH:ubiquinone oxidoreductase subunit B-like Fe-S oxidoreductase
MTLEIQVLIWGMHTKKAGLTRLIRSQPWKWFAWNQENMFWCIDMSMNCCFSELTLKKTNKHGGLDKIKIFSRKSLFCLAHHVTLWWENLCFVQPIIHVTLWWDNLVLSSPPCHFVRMMG